jgi:hypothetical protein
VEKKIPFKKNNEIKNYAKYSGIAFQMAGIIALGVFGGIELDKFTNLKFPIFTFILTIVSVVLSIYIAIKDFIKKK